MPIDWSRPIELENGKRAELISVRSKERNSASVRIWSDHTKRNEREWEIEPGGYSWTYDGNGVWVGDEGYNLKWRIVNVDDSASFIPEDWS